MRDEITIHILTCGKCEKTTTKTDSEFFAGRAKCCGVLYVEWLLMTPTGQDRGRFHSVINMRRTDELDSCENKIWRTHHHE